MKKSSWMSVYGLLLLCIVILSACSQADGKRNVSRESLAQDVTTHSAQTDKVENSVRSEESTDIDNLEIPVSPKGLSETIKQRTAYTLSYNHEMRNPNWVAWVLTSDHTTGPAKRADYDFEDDDDMPDPVGTKADYYNKGYDRGHMCPAGDCHWSAQAMTDCFLMTNMCPQNNSLNRGVWNTIEQQCRSWAKKYGKVYIVCGPVYLNKEHRKLGKNKVVVPDAFFKVVLCMEGTPKAIGFVCRNQSQKGRKKTDFVNTIDDVERITGYDFFSALPDDVENTVESKCGINEW